MQTFDAEAFADIVVGAIKGAIDGPLIKKRFERLEERIAVLERKPYVKFCGTWSRDTTYEPGEAVVCDGGLWICKVHTPGEPKKDFVGWQLAVRKGSL